MPSGHVVLAEMSPVQKKVFDFCCRYAEINQFYPTSREIALILQVNQTRASQITRSLIEKGYMMRTNGVSRKLSLTEEGLAAWREIQESKTQLDWTEEELDSQGDLFK